MMVLGGLGMMWNSRMMEVIGDKAVMLYYVWYKQWKSAQSTVCPDNISYHSSAFVDHAFLFVVCSSKVSCH